MSVTKEQVLGCLAGVQSPEHIPLPQSGALSEIIVTDGKVFFSLNADEASAGAWESVRAQAEAAVRKLPGVASVLIALTAERKGKGPAPTSTPQRRTGLPPASAHRAPSGPSPMAKQADIPGVAAVIAVASGKGGVGKSTTALNIALALRDLGLRVGLLDADIYGPSMPTMTGIHEKPIINDAKKMVPIERFGLRIMSIGFLVEEGRAMIWRGPMVMGAITQMLREVEWGELDILVTDMPPGTGDAQLTLAQQVPLKGAVIVSTPQDLSLIDARRGLAMFQQVKVPVLGIVENMSYFQCPHCGTRSDIFGHGGARHEAEKLGVPFLGEIPLHMDIRAMSDAGTPVVVNEPDGPHAALYRGIAQGIIRGIGEAVGSR